MRRYAVISAVLLLAAAFLAAWVNAQEVRRRAPRVSDPDMTGGEFQAVQPTAPRPFAAEAKAMPIDREPEESEPSPYSAVQPAAGPGEGEPEEAEPQVARRPRVS